MTHFAAIAAASLVAAIWQGALLALAVALLLRLAPEIPAATRSLVWTATFALVVALHFLPTHTAATPSDATTHLPALHANPAWSLALAGLWLTLSLYRAIQFALSAARLRQIARNATPLSADLHLPFIAPPSEAIAGYTSRDRTYTLCTSPDIDRPSVLGFLHPRILLPAGLVASLTPGELHQILLHETEHLRRSDDWTNLLQKLALVLFPLNPVLFWVERRLCLERELACDDRVLRESGAHTGSHTTVRKAYATTLTHLAEHSIMRRSLNLALGLFTPCPSELATRVHRILLRPANPLTRTQTRFATASLLAGVLGVTTTLAHAPTLISFNGDPLSEAATQPIAHSSTSLGAPRLASANWVPKPTLAKALAPAQTFRAVDAVARTPISHRPRTVRRLPWGNNAQETQQPRPIFTAAQSPTPRVQHVYVRTVVYEAPAYAALRTPDGWIIFQL